MTLATYITVLGPVPVEKLYTLVDSMVNDSGEPSIVERTPGKISNRAGQGNRSMLDITYGLDGPIDEQVEGLIEYERERAAYPDEPDYGISDWYAPLPYCAKIRLDTAYGFDEPGIGSCSDLHGAIILAVAAFAADYATGIMWRNEYTGEWFEGFDGLDDFATNGASALSWFENLALPAMTKVGFQ